MSDFSSSVKHPIVDDSEHEQPSLNFAELQLEQITIETKDADPDYTIAQLKQQLVEQQQQLAEQQQQLAQLLAEHYQQQLAEKSNEIEQLHKKNQFYFH